MKKYKIKIDKIILNEQFIIESKNKELFIANIIKGSVDFPIYNENKEEMHLGNIDVGDNITIYGSMATGEKNIIIKKIKIKNKYIFSLESSEELETIDDFI